MISGNFYTEIGDASTVKRFGIDVDAHVAVPPNANSVLLQAVGANVRWTHDGTTPEAGVGMILVDGDAPIRLSGKDCIRNLRFFEASGVANIYIAFLSI